MHLPGEKETAPVDNEGRFGKKVRSFYEKDKHLLPVPFINSNHPTFLRLQKFQKKLKIYSIFSEL